MKTDLPSTRSHPSGAATAPLCCGSETLRSDMVKNDTGKFSRDWELGFITITGLTEGEDHIAPNKVIDLVADVSDRADSILLNFTSPGNDATNGRGDEN